MNCLHDLSMFETSCDFLPALRSSMGENTFSVLLFPGPRRKDG